MKFKPDTSTTAGGPCKYFFVVRTVALHAATGTPESPTTPSTGEPPPTMVVKIVDSCRGEAPSELVVFVNGFEPSTDYAFHIHVADYNHVNNERWNAAHQR